MKPRCPGSFRQATTTLMKQCQTFRTKTTKLRASWVRGQGLPPLAGPSAEVTTVDDAEEDNGFEMVDDGEGEPSDKVVITIAAKEVAKPEGSGLAGKTLMFESEEEDDPEIKKQIEAVLDETGLLGELMLLGPEGRVRVREFR